jgi:hypothetical protein
MIPNVKAPFSLAVFTAYKVSAVSPDWDIATNKVYSLNL